jgi:hypothetical protein
MKNVHFQATTATQTKSCWISPLQTHTPDWTFVLIISKRIRRRYTCSVLFAAQQKVIQ